MHLIQGTADQRFYADFTDLGGELGIFFLSKALT
jgi:hypothetical protein